MRTAYTIILTPAKEGYLVTIPDFECNTEGKDIADALFMARDAIGLMGITMQDQGEDLPLPGSAKFVTDPNDLVLYADVDFSEYRRRIDTKKVKKTLSIPSWLNEQAERENVNFSRILEEALLDKLNIAR